MSVPVQRDKDFLAYDAEDHAAEWWNDWGLLQQRASRQVFVVDGRLCCSGRLELGERGVERERRFEVTEDLEVVG